MQLEFYKNGLYIDLGNSPLNSELYPPFVRRIIADRLIFDTTQYLFAPAKNSDPEA